MPVLITTGGTIASTATPNGGLRASLDGSMLKGDVPFDRILDHCCVPSPEIRPSHWTELAYLIHQLPQGDGVVLTHGTDTMEYTAAALSFALGDQHQPVVLTGAMYAPSHPHSDGLRNVRLAHKICRLLADRHLGGVYVMMNDSLWLGTRVQKCGYKIKGFGSPLNRPLARKIEGEWRFDVDVVTALTLQRNERPFAPNFCDAVDVATISPLSDVARLIDGLKGLRGLLLHSYGCGAGASQGPTSLLPLLHKAQEQQITVVNTTSAVDGVDLNRYSNCVDCRNAGLIGAKNATLACALTKLSWVLAQSIDPAQAFVEDYCGEYLPL